MRVIKEIEVIFPHFYANPCRECVNIMLNLMKLRMDQIGKAVEIKQHKLFK